MPLEQILANILNTYYHTVDAIKPPGSILARVLQPVVERLIRYNARGKLRSDLRDAITRAHLEAAGQAFQGTIPYDALPDIRARLNEQYAYLEGFIGALPSLSREAALARLALYARPASQETSRVAAYDLPPLPHYPGDYDLECHGFCKCHLRIVRYKVPGDFDVWWVVDVDAEHCDDCLRLARDWSPLQIRAGKLMGLKHLPVHLQRALERALGEEYVQ